MRDYLKFLLLVVFILCLPMSVLAEPLAVIVHKRNTVDQLATKELRLIYQGELRQWEDGQNVVLIHRHSDSRQRNDFERLLYGKVLAQQFGNLGRTVPVLTLASDDEILNFVAHTPNAIAYISLGSTNETVKVLRVDEKLPTEKSYLLR